VHVVLDWDEPRAALVRGLHALGIAQIVLVAGDIPGAQTAEGVPLHRLDPDDLAGSLAAMPVQCR
jgi:5,10-methylenetetrahydrofolate reductase